MERLREEFEKVCREKVKIDEEERTKALEIEQRYSERLKVLFDKLGEQLKSLPKFWLRAFTAHPILVKHLNNKDHEIFEYLTSIEVEDNQDVSSGYSITFNFDDNPYFDKPSIAKSFTYHEGKLKEVIATTIQWKEGKSMPNEVRPNELVQDQSTYELSFFNWFYSTKKENELKVPDELADLIKNKFWIDQLKYLHNDLEETDEDEDEEDGDYEVDSDDEEENQ